MGLLEARGMRGVRAAAGSWVSGTPHLRRGRDRCRRSRRYIELFEFSSSSRRRPSDTAGHSEEGTPTLAFDAVR